MKRILLACLAALGLSATAEAATYSVNVTAQPYRNFGAAGLITRAVVLSPSGPQNFNGSTIGFDLSNVGDSATLGLYGLVTYEPSIDADDLTPGASNTTLDFAGLGSLVIQGQTRGVLGTPNSALATFLDGFIYIGDGLRVLVSLADTVFATDGSSYLRGRPGVGVVTATFTLAPVPLPATLPLGLGALGLMGFVARRRKTPTAL